jgi:uncharacterized caspase-like protein
MTILSLAHYQLLIFSMLGLTLLAACNPNQTWMRDPGGIASDSTPYTPPSTIQTVQSPYGSQILASYSGSYALLIGESRYTNGWSNLESIPGELQQVEKILKLQGFNVEKSFNLNNEQLKKRFDTFINQYGFDENNRLLFFYSGHGHTRNDKGYIVPVDAANPNFDEKAFLQKAVGMNQILTWSRRIEAKHVLFLFDSCFSGTVFKAKNLPKIPLRQITQAAQLPVRQFITAGSANETVPAKSVFAPVFVDALRYGFGDTNKDGYVTGQELGLYLWNKVPKHTEQTPQYGKIKDYELSRGDFVFVVNSHISSQQVIKKCVALVIGNNNYLFASLKNPINDATDIAYRLKNLGFNHVAVKKNLSHRAMEQAIRSFGKRLGRGTVGLFYFSGDGTQSNGKDFLMPVDNHGGNINKTISVDFVLENMKQAGNTINILVLDACRDNLNNRYQGHGLTRGIRGSVQMNEHSPLPRFGFVPPKNSFVAFSTSPGQLALDGNGRNSPYTKNLLNFLQFSHLSIEQIFKKVRISVTQETQSQQIPWEFSTLTEDFYFSICNK